MKRKLIIFLLLALITCTMIAMCNKTFTGIQGASVLLALYLSTFYLLNKYAQNKSGEQPTVKMKFKDAPIGARFRYPGLETVWVKINSYPKGILNDGNGLIAQWNGNNNEYQSMCSFVDNEKCITFDTIVELI